LSGSRDGSALLWGPGKGKEWDVKLRVEAPEKKYVSCVGMTRWQGEGESFEVTAQLLVYTSMELTVIAFLLVGSSSGILSSYTLPSATSNPPPGGQMQDPYHTLIEHKQNLCCMDTSKNGLIATGSWDQ
jgi:phospholipase A-2-activating protein